MSDGYFSKMGKFPFAKRGEVENIVLFYIGKMLLSLISLINGIFNLEIGSMEVILFLSRLRYLIFRKDIPCNRGRIFGLLMDPWL